jgi:hypothetical protein
MKRKVLFQLGICLLLLFALLPTGLSAESFADSAFESVWQRTDKPIADGRVARSWMWGPEPFTGALYESYAESPGGSRLVQYFDKSRMEINDPDGDRSSQWFVTNGLLVREMVDGRVQIGDSSYETRSPAQEAVAGDPVANNPSCPVYGSFTYLTWEPAENRSGQKVTATLARDGTVGDDPSKADYAGTAIAHYEEATGHNVPQVLWDFMNQTGLIYSGGSYYNGKVVDWLFAMGYPISEPYWARCTVGGEEKDVLVQLFERRVLTYTPSNPANWQVEMGNVGQHYYTWRYGSTAPPSEPPPPAEPGCEGVPADVSGSITPKCLSPGESFTMSIWGFSPNEQIGFWLTDPYGNIVGTVETVSIGPEGSFTWPPIPMSDTADPGLYYWVFEGTSSGHQAILYFKVIPLPFGVIGCSDYAQCPSAISIWDLVGGMQGMDAPGVIEHEVWISAGTKVYAGIGWCTANETLLQDNLSKGTWTLKIDGQDYSGQLASRQYQSGGYPCQYFGAVIQGWELGRTYTVEFGHTFHEDINDGFSVYPAGEYVWRFTMHAQ